MELKKRKQPKNPNIQRNPFEKIIKDVFEKYRDNVACAADVMDEIIDQVTEKIRAQLHED
jgi:histone H3/H4